MINIMKIKILIIIFSLLTTAGCVKHADPIASNPIGKVYQENIVFGKINVPLPQGKWIVIGRGNRASKKSFESNFIEVILLNPENKNTVRIITNSLSNTTLYGYKQNKYLNRTNLHHVVVNNNNPKEAHDGWAINHYRQSFSSGKGAATESAIKYIKQNKIVLPGNYIQSYHHFTGEKLTNEKYLSYEYLLNPESEGFAPPKNSVWASSDWHQVRISADPKKVAYIEKIIKDGEIFHKILKTAFDK